MLGLVERVLMALPQAQRISDSTYLGCIFSFIEATPHNITAFRKMTSVYLQLFGKRAHPVKNGMRHWESSARLRPAFCRRRAI
jgi:hypothetical protein